VIELQTLGPIAIHVNGEEPPRELLWRKNLALLLYLVRSPGRRRSREHLVGLLWGDKPDDKARHSLNEALRVLRSAGDDGLLESVGDQVVLDESGIRIDVEELDARVAENRLAEAVELVRGSWMEGFAVPESTPFEDWLAAERMHWNATATGAMQVHGAALLARGNETGAQEIARRMLQIDPFSDAGIRLLMEAAALRGERASALGLFEEFRGRLADELGIEPEPDTAALAERVGVERTWKLPRDLPQEEIWARRVPLVGRRREMETMVSVVRRAMSDRRPAVLICQGESGSGKTRLAEEVVARARLEGAAVASIRAVASDTGTEWSVLYGLAAGGLLAAEGAAVAPPEALAAFLGKLGWQDPALREHASGATPRPLPRAFTEVAQAVAELRPLLLWIDNAEHADASSAAALPGLVRDLGGEPCTVLLTLHAWPPRPEFDELRTRIGRDLAGATVTLDPLSADDIAQLAGAMLPRLDDEERGRLARRIAVDSAGLPLFAVELLNGVRLGLELEEEAAWPKPFQTMDQTYPGDLPDSVTAAIRIGFRRLSEPAREALGAAAVLEDRVEPEVLVRATGLDRERLLRALDELEWNRWMTADARGYSFVARIVRDVVGRDMLTPGQRRRIREAAGAAPPSS
jgi:DNA-binding SARP family transcriptional activator